MPSGGAWFPSRRELSWRELGLSRPGAFASRVSRRRGDAATLSGDKTFAHRWAGGVNALALDQTERRYLLAGTVDAVVAAYDVEQPTLVDAATRRATHEPVFRLGKGDGTDRAPGHAFGVSSVAWYPVDTGVFFTASFDETAAVWDTNALQRVATFDFPGSKVYAIAVPPSRSSSSCAHSLLACGTSDPRVRLCDPLSGAVTHALAGHRDAIMALAWVTGSEWVLASGSADGDIRLWDVRRAGSFMVLDATNARVATQDPLRQSVQFPELPDAPVPAGPTPATRRNVDAVPDHLFSVNATRCGGSSNARRSGGGGGGFGGGSGFSRGFSRGGGGYWHGYGGGSAGGGGWGMGFRAPSSRGGGGGSGGSVGAAAAFLGSSSGSSGGGGGASGRRLEPPGASKRAANGGSAHSGAVTALACSPDGLFLASAGTDDAVRLWALSDGQRVDGGAFGRAPNERRKATQLAFSADGARLYHPSSDGDVLVFDAKSASSSAASRDRDRDRDGPPRTANEEENGPAREDRSGSGLGTVAKRRKTGSTTVRNLRNLRGGRRASDAERANPPSPFATLRGHLAAACAVATHPDSREVYTGGADRHVLCWRPPRPTHDPPRGRRGRRGGGGTRGAEEGEEEEVEEEEDGAYRPFLPPAELRARAADYGSGEDDWSEDEAGRIRPDPDARRGVHGLGYRRGARG
jgi:DNA excision repair protein ERCC-8